MAVQHMMLFWIATTDTGGLILDMARLPFEIIVGATCIGFCSIGVHMLQTKIPLD